MADAREALARLVRTLDAKSAEDQERLGRYWDRGLADGDVKEDVYRRTDAILAEFDVVPRGERAPTAYRVARWRHTRWFEPHPARPTDVYLRPEGGVGAHALYAGCRDCDGALLPETFEPVPPDAAALPSVEDVARAREFWWASHLMGKRSHRNVRRSSFDAGFDAALALISGRTEAEVKAEALRGAAREVAAEEFLRALPPAEYGETAVETAADWLNDLADTIEKEADRG